MTIKKFFNIFLLQLVLLIALKVVFYRAFDYTQFFWEVLCWVAVGAVAAVLVRRFGVINFLEAFFIAGFWFLLDLVLDFFITQPLTGVSIFATASLWFGYLVLMLSVFFFHKKRHIHIRKEQAAHHHHGHH